MARERAAEAPSGDLDRLAHLGEKGVPSHEGAVEIDGGAAPDVEPEVAFEAVDLGPHHRNVAGHRQPQGRPRALVVKAGGIVEREQAAVVVHAGDEAADEIVTENARDGTPEERLDVGVERQDRGLLADQRDSSAL